MSAVVGLKEGDVLPGMKVKDIMGVDVETNPKDNDAIQMISFAGSFFFLFFFFFLFSFFLVGLTLNSRKGQFREIDFS